MSAVSSRRPWVAPGLWRTLFGAQTSRTVGVAILAVVVLMCIFVPMLWPYGPNDFVALPLQPPEWAHPFGTDAVGRDVFVRTFAGGRIDLVAAVLTAGFSLVVGTVIGTASGVVRSRWVDALIMRIADAVIAFPALILLLTLVVMFGSDSRLFGAPAGLGPSLAALMCVQWAVYARLARGQALTLRNSDFVVASRLAGLSGPRIVFGHILPGVSRITLAYAIGDVVLVVVILASLPFLGAGVQPPTAEWGSIMYEGRAFLRNAWWIIVLPGSVLAITGLGLSFVADSFLSDRRDGR
ncbi:ABC-type dipeptide/oligopeptide/nickel transport system, permease component [Wenxinia marina DSM 24838]|uniref:ABC-type dipeptide/oligopeptide/nickel transport system, permease component n=2 Tax=Wenxinia TaxID=653686 RepID=A0A0D0Q776_9RHOB|nr:ABC-type dipeptide/oligopeptide/nickel transport system, permease component [Wenxinia marina DSM 24838]